MFHMHTTLMIPFPKDTKVTDLVTLTLTFVLKIAFCLLCCYRGHSVSQTRVFLARRDECPESYCRTPGVGVGVGVGVRVYKNFNLAYNS